MSCINSFLEKCFSSSLSGITLPMNLISHQLVKVAKSNSYVETLGTNADTIHLWIKKSYEDDFKRAFEIQVKKAIKQLGISYSRLAFDITYEPFYGTTRNLFIFDTPKNKKIEVSFDLFQFVCLPETNKFL